MNTIHDESILTEKQIQRLQARLYEVQGAIHHWTDKERVAKNYLAQRLEEQAKLQKQLNYQAELLNDIQSEEEQADAKLLFAECEQIDPSECDAYDLDPTDKVEVHKCKATGWHYLYDPTAEVCPYYCCITINSGEFDTLEQLQKWARPLYFQ